ncbi:MAG: GMC oxidoreductase [Planctomycetes bacterium]|jgi:cholesterol oxidase|nr:GMC oxidoreductase [Planctomycetota bacterium]
MATDEHWDWIVIGSGFGGSVSALRLVEKGYRVLVLEQGRRFGAEDFAHTNWNLKRWLWEPRLGCRGIFRMTFLRHLTALSGVGVGGGSLVYACTLPKPQGEFFRAQPWGELADWEKELEPHYETALTMLGADEVPFATAADDALGEVGRELGCEDGFAATRTGIWFGQQDVTVPDPYFDGRGPSRTGCRRCGGCMVGCRHGAKNTLDKNYLHLAEGLGARVMADTQVVAVRQPTGSGSVTVEALGGARLLGRRRLRWTAERVILAGGVLGTLPLLLRMGSDPNGLPHMSRRVGCDVRTNSESLLGIAVPSAATDHSLGVAIGSRLHLDERTTVEPVRYPAGSGFFRFLTVPRSVTALGAGVMARVLGSLGELLCHPLTWARIYIGGDWARKTLVLLWMRTAPESLRLSLVGRRRLRSSLEGEGAPRADRPEALELAGRVARRLGGRVGGLATETLLGSPTTAHILGGCGMGRGAEDGVIDVQHRLFGHPDLMVIDGSAVSANPGVNPSLTITALAERALERIQPASEVDNRQKPSAPKP